MASTDDPSGTRDASGPGDAELVQLRTRTIALENLLLAILAESSDAVRQNVLRRASEIQPREGATDHPLTRHAAEEMKKLLERAERFGNA